MTAPAYQGALLPWPLARTVAAALLKARLDAGRAQCEVAGRLGWSATRLHQKENGVYRMRLDEALALAGELGADPGALGLEAVSRD